VTATGDSWAQELALNLKIWAKKRGVSPFNAIAATLEIPKPAWSRISAGVSIVNDTEIYARIYLHTGLQQADPRTVPPRPYLTPSGRGRQTRAWTEDEWQDWIKKKSVEPRSRRTESRPKKTRPVPIIPKPRQEVERIVVGAGIFSTALDGLVNSVVENIATSAASRVVREVDRLLDERFSSPSKPSAKNRSSFQASDAKNVGQLADLLSDALEATRSGSVEDRNRLVEKYGRSLGRLWAYIEAYVNKDEVREERLRQIREVEV